MTRELTDEMINDFKVYLADNERSRATVSKYLHDVMVFYRFVENKKVDKSLVTGYKERLLETHSVTGANSMIAAVNTFLRFLGWNDCCVKQYRVQRQVYCSEEKELTKSEYMRLISTANATGNERISLIIQTICGTGIRVSELEFITVEALKKGEACVSCKGKTRTVFIVSALRKKLLNYSKKHNIKKGILFVTKNGNPVNRSNIWREMKNLCKEAGVSPKKVFPHNLRHLFARTFYGIEKDIAKLADILGHTSINTTRIYIITTGAEHKRKLENMRLII
ncbi:MAG: tyrosine-type recombinase/integrase [Clostridia bacterium]|nr:tyrosine-type recombinase/integrase [Clostridia bacterium]